MQKKFSKQAYLFVATTILFTASCRKNNSAEGAVTETRKELRYAGSSEVLSEGRYAIPVLQTGDYTCFTGGTYFSLFPFGTYPSSNIDVYNAKTNTWERYGLSVKRQYYGAAALNNKLVVGGGYTPQFTYSAVVDIYDLATGAVITKSLSKARAFLAAAGSGNKILFGGGTLPVLGNLPTNTVDVYNTQTGTWTTDTLSQARSGLLAGSVGNKILFAGGAGWNGNQTFYSDRVDIYDTQTGGWTQATLSQPRYNGNTISAGNKIFFFGGVNGSAENVDVYDAQSNRWTVLPLTGNTLNYLLSCTNGSQVFFAHGSNFNFTKLTRYDVSTGAATTVSLPAPMRASAMAAIENKLLIAPGVLSDTVTKKLFVFDTKTARFDSTDFSLSEKKGNLTAAAAGNKLLLAGGVWDGFNAMNQREAINFKSVSVFELK